MVTVTKHGVLLNKTTNSFENEGVLNPAAIRVGEFVHMFYRAVHDGNMSSIGYCRLNGPLKVDKRNESALISPEFAYEAHGMEDPRIVRIDELYYMTYTAFDGVNALGALATSSDLEHFEKKGIIVPQITYDEFMELAQSKKTINEKYTRYNRHEASFEQVSDRNLLWDKNLIFFPRKINGQFYFLHRIKPDIQVVVKITNLSELTVDFWKEYFVHFDDYRVLSPKFEHEVSYIGGGCPPIETKQGWILIYHAVCDTAKGYVYSACVALLDLENPKKEISRLPYPLFVPEFSWELKGEVNNVCFPTGAVVFDNLLYIYYGAADERIACASVDIDQLLEELLHYKI